MASQVEYIEEPRLARWLYGSSQAGWIWFVARLWLGWHWFHFGWRKVFGGEITWRFWKWGDPEISLTGPANIGWVRGGEIVGADGAVIALGPGDKIASTIKYSLGAEAPDVWFPWYADYLEWIQDTAHPVIGPVVAVGELLIGLGLLVGAFVGIAAFFGVVLNTHTMLMGISALAPMMIVVEVFLILAWRNAGFIGLDRYLLPKLGTPWHPGELSTQEKGRSVQEVSTV